MNQIMRIGLITLALCVTASYAGEPTANSRPNQFRLLDGDRVVLLGSTYVERMQTYGYLETRLTTAYADRNITFRNLGWSGDDVFGSARALFGTQDDGFARLRKDVFEAKPTVIIVCYGANEAHDGEAGIDRFEQGFSRLLDTLEETGARIVLVAPSHRQHLQPPFLVPDPAGFNANLLKYCDAIRDVAAAREHHFVDFFRPLGNSGDISRSPTIRDRLTDNSVHFNQYGYWRTAPSLALALGAAPYRWQTYINAKDQSYDVVGATLTSIQKTDTGIRFAAVDRVLPYLPAPEFSPHGGELSAPHAVLRVACLQAGSYGLQINGKPTIMASHEDWELGVHINLGKYDEQLGELHRTIEIKNELYFHRYRPQNETYLFLFRKHEQGNNAVEIPQFDPLIAEQEATIAKLRKPRARTYELVMLKPEEE